MKRVLLLGCAVCGLLGGLARADEAAAPANPMCPVLTDQPAKLDIHADYQGRRIHFCCPMCRAKFIAAPAQYLANLPGAVATGSAASRPDGSARESASHRGGHEADGGGMAGPTAHQHSGGSPTGHLHTRPEGARRLIRLLGKFHVVFVHFPIALVLLAGVAELLGIRRGNRAFFDAGRFCIVWGAALSIITVGLGFAAGAFAVYRGDLATILDSHRWAGTVTGVFALATAALCELSHRGQSPAMRVRYRVALSVTAISVAATGFLGGALVHGLDHFSW